MAQCGPTLIQVLLCGSNTDLMLLLLRELFKFYNEYDISVVKHISSCNYSSHYITSKSTNCAEENNLLHHEEKCDLKKSQATAGSITTVTIGSFI